MTDQGISSYKLLWRFANGKVKQGYAYVEVMRFAQIFYNRWHVFALQGYKACVLNIEKSQTQHNKDQNTEFSVLWTGFVDMQSMLFISWIITIVSNSE